ncbi:MAG: DinB family protein [Saprospiraceae bacterium]
MQSNVQTFLRQYKSIRKRTLKLLEVVQPQHLDFAYKPGKFTLADQMRHIGAIERYLYAETIADRKNAYRGCGKELADGYENILAFLHQTHAESLEIFENLTDSQLDEICYTPTGHPIKKGKWMELLAEHEIHHRAEIYLYLNLLDVQTPPMYGLTAEEVAGL